MILSTSQARRFIKLFNLLMDHVKKTQEGVAALREIDGRDPEREALVADAMLSLLWGPEGGTEVLAAYVEDNPDRLSRTDLREVASWKDGVYDTFPAVRLGHDVAFLYGGYALAVRGIRCEVDAQDTLPDTVRTVVVPFDGVLTYGTVLTLEHVPTQDERRAIEARAQGIVDERGLVRSVRQFVKVLPDARANAAKAADVTVRGGESPKGSAATAGAATAGTASAAQASAAEGAEPLHRGVLAGLTWEERSKALEDRFAAEQAADYRARTLSFIDSACAKGVPATSILESCRRLTKRELTQMARNNRDEFGSDGSHMTKEQLARALSEFLVAHGTELADHEMHTGEATTKSLRRLVEAGGELLVPFEGDGVLDMPTPFTPMIRYHKTPQGYLVWLAPEIFDQIVDLDWDERVAQARTFDEACDRISRMVELRGVVACDEALDRVASIVERSIIEDVIHTRLVERRMIFTEETIDGQRYFAHVRFDHAAELQGGELGSRKAFIREILAYQKLHLPHDESVLDKYGSVLYLVETYPSYRNLVAYLDERVPEGDDEYLYAHAIADEIVDCTQYFFGDGRLEDFFDFHTVLTSDYAEFDRLRVLASALMNDVPRWSLNGWSHNEIALIRAGS